LPFCNFGSTQSGCLTSLLKDPCSTLHRNIQLLGDLVQNTDVINAIHLANKLKLNTIIFCLRSELGKSNYPAPFLYRHFVPHQQKTFNAQLLCNGLMHTDFTTNKLHYVFILTVQNSHTFRPYILANFTVFQVTGVLISP